MILELGHDIYKMSLEHLQVQKATIPEQQNKNKNPHWWGLSNNTVASWKSSQWLKLEQLEQEKKVILDFNPKYNMNILESTLV